MIRSLYGSLASPALCTGFAFGLHSSLGGAQPLAGLYALIFFNALKPPFRHSVV
jgi:hypothetical protein